MTPPAHWTAKSDELAVNVFAYEYSGYGLASGAPSERHICADAAAALAYMTDALGLRPARDIVLYAKSIGTTPALDLARRHPFRGVILLSGLATGARTVSRRLGGYADGLRSAPFNNLARLRELHEGTAVQLIHGTKDEIVPMADAKLMYAACKAQHPREPCWVDGAKHNGLESEFEETTTAVRAFLAHVSAAPWGRIGC